MQKVLSCLALSNDGDDMKLALVAFAAFSLVVVCVDALLRFVAHQARKRFDSMSPDERFKYQNEMRKMQP